MGFALTNRGIRWTKPNDFVLVAIYQVFFRKYFHTANLIVFTLLLYINTNMTLNILAKRCQKAKIQVIFNG